MRTIDSLRGKQPAATVETNPKNSKTLTKFSRAQLPGVTAGHFFFSACAREEGAGFRLFTIPRNLPGIAAAGAACVCEENFSAKRGDGANVDGVVGEKRHA
jgi:hypothetical protein